MSTKDMFLEVYKYLATTQLKVWAWIKNKTAIANFSYYDRYMCPKSCIKSIYKQTLTFQATLQKLKKRNQVI